MDKLKQYLERRRAEMDVDLPPGSVWQNIQAEGSQQMIVKRLPAVVRYAAAALLLLIGSGLWWLTNKRKEQQVVKVRQEVKPAPNQTELVLQKKDGKGQALVIEPVVSVKAKEKPSPKKIRSNQSKSISDDVAGIDKGYAKLVSYQVRRLRTTPVYVESPDYFDEFVGQLAQMDKDEQAIKKDIKRYGMSDHLLESLLNIYQQKLNLLKSLQKEIRQMNNSVEGKPDRQELHPYYLNL